MSEVAWTWVAGFGATSALFLDSYLAHNPWHAEKMQAPGGIGRL